MCHLAVKEWGLRPLVFHVDCGWNSKIAVSNINNLVDCLGVELHTEVVNWKQMREFQLAMFKSGVPHLDVPQDIAFISVLYKFALDYGIKYIFNGGNIATEGVPRPLKYVYWGSDKLHFNDIIRKFHGRPLENFTMTSAFYQKAYLPFVRRIKVIKPLNFVPYSKEIATDTLERLYGWNKYEQKHFESVFTRFLKAIG